MGVQADTIKNVTIDNDGETVTERVEVSTKSGDNFEFEAKHDFFGGNWVHLTLKGPNGPLVVLEQGPSINRLLCVSGVSTVKGDGEEFVAMTDFGKLNINLFDGLLVSMKAEKTELFRVWADNPHE